MTSSVNRKRQIPPLLIFWTAVVLLFSCSDDRPDLSDKPTLLFLGDSVTEGFRLPPADSYPSLIQKNHPEYRVLNGGRSGDTAELALHRLSLILEKEPRVDFCGILLGYNDFFQGVDPEETRDSLLRIVESLRSRYPGIRIYLFSITGGPFFPPSRNEQYREIYDRVAEISGVPLLPDPVLPILQQPGLLQEDGVHPTVAGMNRIAQNIEESLMQRIEEDSP